MANLGNNKNVFMCIWCFHARAGYLQHYETLLKEINADACAQSHNELLDQYDVKRSALPIRNLNVPCASESGIRYPSLVAMLNRQLMSLSITVFYIHISVHTCTHTPEDTSTYWYILLYACSSPCSSALSSARHHTCSPSVSLLHCG